LSDTGKDETQVEKLRSILAQLEYKHQVDLWHSKGVPFKDHLYVPEVHPITGFEFCEREDEAHILKVSRKAIMLVCSIGSGSQLVTQMTG